MAPFESVADKAYRSGFLCRAAQCLFLHIEGQVLQSRERSGLACQCKCAGQGGSTAFWTIAAGNAANAGRQVLTCALRGHAGAAIADQPSAVAGVASGLFEHLRLVAWRLQARNPPAVMPLQARMIGACFQAHAQAAGLLRPGLRLEWRTFEGQAQ